MASEIVQVMLPSGDLVWVHIETPRSSGNGRDGDRPQDVGFRDKTETVLGGLEVPGSLKLSVAWLPR